MTRSGWLVALVGSLAVVLWLGALQDGGLGVADPDIPRVSNQPLRDIEVVWIVERAIFSGLDPSMPVDELAKELDTELEPGSLLEYHPRLPGAYLLEVWVAFVPKGYVVSFGLGAAALGLFLVVGLTGVLRGRAVPVVFFPLIALTDTVNSLAFWRSTSWMVAVSIIGCWILARRRDGLWAGLALVPGIVLRLYPLVLVPILWIRDRRRAATAAVVGSVLLNVAGLALPSVTVESTIRVLTAGKADFITSFGNASLWTVVMRPGGHLAIPLVLSTLIVIGVWLWSRQLGFDRAFGWAIVAGLVTVPIAWSHFRLALVPLVIHPMGLVVWAIELVGRMAFEWRWIIGFIASVMAGIIWHIQAERPRLVDRGRLDPVLPPAPREGS